MGKKSDQKPWKKIENPTRNDLAKAQAHSLRIEILEQLKDGTRGSPNRICKVLDKSLNLVAYHMRVLDKYDCIRMVDTAQRRGATEHFYESTGRIKLDTAPELDKAQRGLLVQLVDEFADKNGFSPDERTELHEARKILAAA